MSVLGKIQISIMLEVELDDSVPFNPEDSVLLN